MPIKYVPSKSFMTKTNLGGSNDFTCNPYIGCTHGCVYCYAKTIDRTHPQKEWGHFVEVRTYPNTSIKRGTGERSLIFSSMTDSYQPIEMQLSSVRNIMESIQESDLHVTVLTKSSLALRDLDLFLKMKHFKIEYSVSMLDSEASVFEPGASKPTERFEALKKFHDAGIETHVFVAPIIPFVSDPIEIIHQVHDRVDSISFDKLNLKDEENRMNFFEVVRKNYPDRYEQILNEFSGEERFYYRELKKKILIECARFNIPIRYIY